MRECKDYFRFIWDVVNAEKFNDPLFFKVSKRIMSIFPDKGIAEDVLDDVLSSSWNEKMTYASLSLRPIAVTSSRLHKRMPVVRSISSVCSDAVERKVLSALQLSVSDDFIFVAFMPSRSVMNRFIVTLCTAFEASTYRASAHIGGYDLVEALRRGVSFTDDTFEFFEALQQDLLVISDLGSVFLDDRDASAISSMIKRRFRFGKTTVIVEVLRADAFSKMVVSVNKIDNTVKVRLDLGGGMRDYRFVHDHAILNFFMKSKVLNDLSFLRSRFIDSVLDDTKVIAYAGIESLDFPTIDSTVGIEMLKLMEG